MLVFTGRTGQVQDVKTILAAKLTRTQEFEDKFQKYTWGIISRFIRKKGKTCITYEKPTEDLETRLFPQVLRE